MRMNGNYKILSPFEGRYNLHISPNCTLNLSTKQSFDKACVKEENRTGQVRSIFRKHFPPKLNVIKTIILSRIFQENLSHSDTFPRHPHVPGACFCGSMRPPPGQHGGWQERPSPFKSRLHHCTWPWTSRDSCLRDGDDILCGGAGVKSKSISMC